MSFGRRFFDLVIEVIFFLYSWNSIFQIGARSGARSGLN